MMGHSVRQRDEFLRHLWRIVNCGRDGRLTFAKEPSLPAFFPKDARRWKASLQETSGLFPPFLEGLINRHRKHDCSNQLKPVEFGSFAIKGVGQFDLAGKIPRQDETISKVGF